MILRFITSPLIRENEYVFLIIIIYDICIKYNIVENLKLTLLYYLLYIVIVYQRIFAFALVNVSSARSKKFLITRNVSMERYVISTRILNSKKLYLYVYI